MTSTLHKQDKQGPTIAILVLDCDPHPPFDSGSLEKASPRAVELASGFIQDWVADSTAKYGQHA
jgi:hypothetical protein